MLLRKRTRAVLAPVIVILVVVVAGGLVAFYISRSVVGNFNATSQGSGTLTTVSATGGSSNTTGACGSRSPANNSLESIVPLFENYSSLGGTYSISSSSVGNVTGRFVYNVVYSGQDIIKVNVSQSGSASGSHFDLSYVFWIMKNGTILAGSTSGQNFSGSSVVGLLGNSPIVYEGEPNDLISVTSQAKYSHLSGSGTLIITGVPLVYDDYVANSIPLTVGSCGDGSASYVSFSVRTGTHQGRNYPLVVGADVTQEENSLVSGFSVRIDSMTLAP